MTRITEQMAILSAIVCGRGIESRGVERSGQGANETAAKRKGSLPPRIWPNFRACLDASLARPARLVAPYPEWNLDDPALNANSPEPHETGVSVIAAPLDGVDAVLQGRHAGAASIVAGGVPGFCAIPAGETDPTRFMVIIGRAQDEALDGHLWYIRDTFASKPGERLEQNGALRELFERIARPDRSLVPVQVVSVPVEGWMGMAHLFVRKMPVRVLHGSPVALALAVAMGRAPQSVFTTIVRRNALALIATIASCLGAPMLAIPVVPESGHPQRSPRDRPAPHVILHQVRPLDSTDIVRHRDAFVTLTCVSECLGLDGVRWVDDRVVTTQTWSLNGLSGSVRSIEHYHDLARERFRSNAGSLAPAEDVIKDFVGHVMSPRPRVARAKRAM